MNTTTMWRTQATEIVTVVTVHVRDGRAQWYETALIVVGRVSDPRRTVRKVDAGFEHDAVVAFVRGYKNPASKRNAELEAALAEVSR